MSIIGGIASALIGKSSADKASRQAGQGFDFLRRSEGVNQAQESGGQAGGLISGLLGLGGDPNAANAAFDQFRESTGFNFRKDQGLSGITQNKAAGGLLNSGSTLKALNQFGQGIASQEFGSFLNQLSGVQNTGLNAAFNTASSGASAGAAQGQFTVAGGNALSGGLNSALGGFNDFLDAPADSRAPLFRF